MKGGYFAPPPRRRKKSPANTANKVNVGAGKAVKLVKVFKTAKLLKPLLTLGSMGASIMVYSFGLGLWFAVGFVFMLFVHEMGHVIALKQKGLKASAPVFIPMLGAVIFAPNMGKRDDEAYMGFAGPLVGGAGALVLLVIVMTTHPSKTVALVAYTAIYLNLFNMIPIRPLDGGRVTQAVGPWFKYVGVFMLLTVTVLLKSPGLLIIWILILSDFRMSKQLRVVLGMTCWAIMAAMEFGHFGEIQPFWLNIFDNVVAALFNVVFAVSSQKDFEEHDDRPQVAKSIKLLWLGLYVLLAAALSGLMVLGHRYIPSQALHH